MSVRDQVLGRLRSERLRAYQGEVIDVELLADLEPLAAPWSAAVDLADAISDHWSGDLADTLDLISAMEPTPAVPTDTIRIAGPLARVRRDLHGGGWAPVEGLGLSGWDLVALHRAGILVSAVRREADSFCLMFATDAVLTGRVGGA